jgi:hypothetical protein
MLTRRRDRERIEQEPAAPSGCIFSLSGRRQHGDRPDAVPFAAWLREHAASEMAHISQFLDMIVRFGGRPSSFGGVSKPKRVPAASRTSSGKAFALQTAVVERYTEQLDRAGAQLPGRHPGAARVARRAAAPAVVLPSSNCRTATPTWISGQRLVVRGSVPPPKTSRDLNDARTRPTQVAARRRQTTNWTRPMRRAS